MPVKFNKDSSNDDYIEFLKELGILNNSTSNKKKDIKCNFKGSKYDFNKYLMIS